MSEVLNVFSRWWADFPNYIIRIVKKIWQKHCLKILQNYFTDHVVMRLPISVLYGNQTNLNSLASTKVKFYGFVLLTKDVIWWGKILLKSIVELACWQINSNKSAKTPQNS